MTKPWTLATAVVAAALFVVSLSDEFYRLTSPPSLSWHVLLRKAYSIAAFALVGYLGRRALLEAGRPRFVLACIVGVTLYSALIEVCQRLTGSSEGLGWNAFDVACGALGGSLAVADGLLRLRQRRRRSA